MKLPVFLAYSALALACLFAPVACFDALGLGGLQFAGVGGAGGAMAASGMGAAVNVGGMPAAGSVGAMGAATSVSSTTTTTGVGAGGTGGAGLPNPCSNAAFAVDDTFFSTPKSEWGWYDEPDPYQELNNALIQEGRLYLVVQQYNGGMVGMGGMAGAGGTISTGTGPAEAVWLDNDTAPYLSQCVRGDFSARTHVFNCVHNNPTNCAQAEQIPHELFGTGMVMYDPTSTDGKRSWIMFGLGGQNCDGSGGCGTVENKAAIYTTANSTTAPPDYATTTMRPHGELLVCRVGGQFAFWVRPQTDTPQNTLGSWLSVQHSQAASVNLPDPIEIGITIQAYQAMSSLHAGGFYFFSVSEEQSPPQALSLAACEAAAPGLGTP